MRKILEGRWEIFDRSRGREGVEERIGIMGGIGGIGVARGSVAGARGAREEGSTGKGRMLTVGEWN